MGPKTLKQFHVALLLAMALAFLSGIPCASAQTRDQRWDSCNNQGNAYAPDVRIRDCNLIIFSGRETQSNLAIGWFNRGLAFNDQGNYARAIEDYYQAIRIADHDQAIRFNPQFASAFNSRGLAYRDSDQAIEDYDHAIRLNPQFVPAHINRGNVYSERGDYVRAIADFNNAIQFSPQNVSAFIARCSARAQWGQQLDLALADCNESLRMRANDPDTLSSRGLVHLRRKEFQAALADYDAAVRGNADLNDALYGRGFSRLQLGQAAEARADIAAATARDTDVAEKFARYVDPHYDDPDPYLSYLCDPMAQAWRKLAATKDVDAMSTMWMEAPRGCRPVLDKVNADLPPDEKWPGDGDTVVVSAVDGRPAYAKEWPFFVALRSVNTVRCSLTYFCGGTLVAEKWIATAAHCLRGWSPSRGRFINEENAVLEAVVAADDVSTIKRRQIFQINSIHTHPGYRGETGRSADIALVELSSPSDSKPVEFPRGDPMQLSSATWAYAESAGFGLTGESADLTTQRLKSQYAATAGSGHLQSVEVFSLSGCSTAYTTFDPVTQLCYGIPGGGRDTCQGDSGGPLVHRREPDEVILIGVVGYGRGCARANAPGVYTSISAYRNWINAVISGAEKDQRFAAVQADRRASIAWRAMEAIVQRSREQAATDELARRRAN